MSQPHFRQNGTVLIVALLFTVILTLLGVSAMTTTTLEEKMSGNIRDSNLAFQAAEAALRDAEQDIEGLGTGTPRSPVLSGATGFGDASATPGTCSTTGLCLPTIVTCAASTTPTAAAFLNNLSAAPSVQYGAYTAATAIAGVASPPRYIIEAVRVCLDPSKVQYDYRVTARGVGANAVTVVLLQQIYRK